MRSALFTVLLFTIPVTISAQDPSPSPMPAPVTTYVRPDKHDRTMHYLKSMFGPFALGKRVVTSGIATWDNSPEEWGTHWDGFGKRFASNTGKSVIGNTTQFALEEAFKLDSRYYRSSGGFGSKIKNAVVSPFAARNEHGRKVLGFPHIAGTYVAHVTASETWYPGNETWKTGLRRGTVSLGTDILFNFIKEFIRR